MKRTLLIIFTVFSTGNFVHAQELLPRKRINSKGDYYHKFTQMNFPLQFEDSFTRVSIEAFDRKKKNLKVTYHEQLHNTDFSISVYPANEGTEDRLRSEFSHSAQSIANLSEDGLYVSAFPVKFHGDNYDCNGIKAIKKSNVTSTFSIYECGTWFFKIELSTDMEDSTEIVALENRILQKFDPSQLTELMPLMDKTDLYLAKGAFRDSTLYGCTIESAYDKNDWVFEHVSRRERASGFPSQYLAMHMSAMEQFSAFDKDHNYDKTEYTEDYLNQINSLLISGYMDEYIMNQYAALIVPENHEFDFAGYEEWIKTHRVTIDLNMRFYVLSFGIDKNE